MRFSANLGFLWADLPLPDAIRAAKHAGFDAVECHWPYNVPPADVSVALSETGLPMLGLNTSRGDVQAGEMGLSALPGQSAKARDAIDQAIDYAVQIKAQNIHVMAGNASGSAARDTFCSNLDYACTAAQNSGLTLLIEPLNHFDTPDYFLTQTSDAAHIIRDIAQPNLKLMFDCYHVCRMGGDVIQMLPEYLPMIGHVQIAAVPDRGAPDHGMLDYTQVFRTLQDLGYETPIGAEYKTNGPTEPTLDWLSSASLH